ncbi:glycosyltransferase family 2 protein [Patescibacteria group bacterium]|nr:glycosyltransferase family 2 protein [Patescibacteria group bacterium]
MKLFKQKPFLIGVIESVIVVGILVHILILFYFTIPTNAVALGVSFNALYGLLYVSMLTDGLILLIHLPRRTHEHKNLSFDPDKLTILIACYNGEKVIAETIEKALTKVKKKNILVASDGSKDKTIFIARKYGVRVLNLQKNMQKAHTISRAIHEVKTPYVLILDDDTHIDKTFIPTSLLDEGYGAVAFSVMPQKTKSLVNTYQIFEYRRSMFIGRGLRSSIGAVGNVSGAIGLFRTRDLVEQDGHHSGQWGGEDQQRTMLLHLKNYSKGITFIDSTVTTQAPDTFKALTKQRTKIWNRSCHELFWLNIRVILNPNSHYILKLNRAYYIFVLLTDPIRIALLWTLLLHPINIFINFGFYCIVNIIYWFKLGAKDSLLTVVTFPFYGKYNTLCRLYAHLHWFKVKLVYYKKKLHARVTSRNLHLEYALTTIILIFFWILALRTAYFHALLERDSVVSYLGRYLYGH